MILYLCDRRKCDKCLDDCELTTDINHAVNFEKNPKGDFEEVTGDYIIDLEEENENLSEQNRILIESIKGEIPESELFKDILLRDFFQVK